MLASWVQLCAEEASLHLSYPDIGGRDTIKLCSSDDGGSYSIQAS
jgi:hypothetical protein